MSEFWAYLQIGFDHITDPNGYDHILFVVALCAIYAAKEWKQILILVTAFTIGHSVTLAISTLDLVFFNQNQIELLISLTIVATCFFNFMLDTPKPQGAKLQNIRYVSALLFGLIHGLGFSTYLKSLLGKQSLLKPLLAFNLGLEIGQLLVVGITLTVGFLFVDLLRLPRQKWLLIVSGIACGMALTLVLNRI